MRHMKHLSLVTRAPMRHPRRMTSRAKLPLRHLLALARGRLNMSQREFGPALGASHRTASRWDTGASTPLSGELARLAAVLVPVDRDLAEEAAAHAGDTLEGLGLVPPRVTTPDLVDAVVCAGADVGDVSPRALRPVLHAAFKRARALGLSFEDVETALAPEEPAIPPPVRAASTRRTRPPT
jgi:DNA-binding transcriptional regulator YiaG